MLQQKEGVEQKGGWCDIQGMVDPTQAKESSGERLRKEWEGWGNSQAKSFEKADSVE